jgi:nucleotide-binding universal stress UspA family protein
MVMKKILVPVDFSLYSKNAFFYAKIIAEKTKAEIILLNCYHLENSIGVDPSESSMDEFESDNRKDHFNQLNNFLTSFSDISKYKIVPLLKPGLAAETILQTIEMENIDFVVMGSKGQSNLITRLFGSVTETIADKIVCPLLVVPSGISSWKIESIAYFTSVNSEKDRMANSLIVFSESIQSILSYICFAPVNMKRQNEESLEKFRKEIYNDNNGKVEVEIINTENVEESISQYIRAHDPDIIAVNLNKKYFIKDVLLKDHTGIELLNNFHIPFLLFKGV